MDVEIASATPSPLPKFRATVSDKRRLKPSGSCQPSPWKRSRTREFMVIVSEVKSQTVSAAAFPAAVRDEGLSPPLFFFATAIHLR